MQWAFLIAGAVLVFAIAAAFVGSEAFRLGHETHAAIFDVDEAVEVVADRLPPDAQARLTFDEVRTLIRATLGYLHDEGLSALPGEDLAAPDHDVVVDDEHALAAVLAAVERDGLDVADVDAALVIDALMGHLGDIGALGPRA
ncbi:MAG: hypothetical protein ACLGI8_10750 [Acidimicrobiia bacterium]